MVIWEVSNGHRRLSKATLSLRNERGKGKLRSGDVSVRSLIMTVARSLAAKVAMEGRSPRL